MPLALDARARDIFDRPERRALDGAKGQKKMIAELIALLDANTAGTTNEPTARASELREGSSAIALSRASRVRPSTSTATLRSAISGARIPSAPPCGTRAKPRTSLPPSSRMPTSHGPRYATRPERPSPQRRQNDVTALSPMPLRAFTCSRVAHPVVEARGAVR